MWPQCHPSSLGSILQRVPEQIWFQDVDPGGHLVQPKVTILAILNLCVTVMPHIKFRPNPTYGLGGDVV